MVGDKMQLPPTSFFASRSTDDEEQILVEDSSGQTVTYDLSSNSLLNHAARDLPATMLGWHYRSRSESLISFSKCRVLSGSAADRTHYSVGSRSMSIYVNSSSFQRVAAVGLGGRRSVG